MTSATATRSGSGSTTLELDAVIIGAGVAGLYQLHQLRKEGFRVRAYDAAADVGGTWYWNRYPGSKFDSESYTYQYLFSEELYKNWSWSHRFPEQPEIERWMQYVADTLDLRRDIQFRTRITKAVYDEGRGRWTVRTDRDDVIDTQFLIACTGMLSAPMADLFPGQQDFRGRIFHTARWPREEVEVELEGKRVGVIGIGATGIQVIQTIADRVDHLTVFARSPQYVLPMKNPAYGPDEVARYKGRFEELRDSLPHTFAGFEYEFEHTWADLTPAQRRGVWEESYANGSLKLWIGAFTEQFFDEQVGEEVSEFVRAKMRERLKDPYLCDVLIPADYKFGTHRVPLESNYLEAYHRDNVELVSVCDNPIVEVAPDGLVLQDGTLYDLDVIIMATGFDAGTGALTRIDIRGRHDRSLHDDWFRDIRTTYGLMVHGYPNLLITAAPLAPSAALCNMTTCLQQQTEWISDCIRHLRDTGKSVIEPTKKGEDAWVNHHDEVANATLFTKTKPGWYMGANVPGKPSGRFLSYCGGVGQYRDECTAEAEAGYPSFDIR